MATKVRLNERFKSASRMMEDASRDERINAV